MRKVIPFVCVFGLAFSALASIIHTNTESLTLATVADGSYNDFRWNWAGYDNEAIVLTWDTTFPAGTKASFRMRRPKDGLIFKEVLTDDITVSGTQMTFSVDGGTNMVPVGSYWAEVISYNTSTSVYRTVAQGMINVNWSLFKDDASYFDYYTNIHSLAASLIYLGTTAYPGNVLFYGDGVEYDSVNDRLVFSGVGTGAVSSVFGRSGVVEAEVGDYSAFYSLLGHTHTIANITGLQAALDGKAGTASVTTVAADLSTHEGLEGTNVHGLGTMAIVDDAPSDGSAYVRQDGVWTNAATAGGYVGTNEFQATNAVFQAAIDDINSGAFMQTYQVITNANEHLTVMATTTNVTASRTGTAITLTIPSGTKVIGVSGRWNAPVLGSSFTLVTGDGTDITDQIAPVYGAYREDNGWRIPGANVQLDMANFDRYLMTGLETATICKFAIYFIGGL